MQRVVYISSHNGVSKKGRTYDIVRVSNGIEAFVLNNPKQIDFKDLAEGDEVDIEVHVSPFMGALRGDIVSRG